MCGCSSIEDFFWSIKRDIMKSYLKLYLNKNNSLDTTVCVEGEEIKTPPDFVKWIEEGDIAGIILPDMEELSRQSDEYWAKKYEAVGLSFPLK